MQFYPKTDVDMNIIIKIFYVKTNVYKNILASTKEWNTDSSFLCYYANDMIL